MFKRTVPPLKLKLLKKNTMLSHNYSNKFVILPYLTTVFIVLLFTSTSWVYADTKEVDPGQITFRNSIAETPYEKIDPYTGELSLTYTDLTLPGNGGLDLSIIRTYQSNRRVSYTPLGLDWDIHMGKIKVNSNGSIMVELHDGTKNTAMQARLSNSAFTTYHEYWTKDFWNFDLSTGSILQLPDGTKIEFNQLGPDGWKYATKISKNGNQILINYFESGTSRINYIIDTLGRRINFNYTPISGINRLITISCADDPNVQVQYNYPGSGNYPAVLSQVVLPGGDVWGFSYHDDTSLLHTVSTPYGGTISYTYDDFSRYWDGFSSYFQISVNRKTVSGTQLNGIWVYDYGTDTNRDRDFTKITDSCNRITTYWFFGYHGADDGSCYKYGLQDEMEIRDTNNNNQLEYWEQNIWGSLPNELSSMPYATTVCRDTDTYVPVLLKQTIKTLGGSTYTTQYSNYDNFGNPGTQTETGSASKTTRYTYWYDIDDNIVKGKPATISIEGSTSSFPGSFSLEYAYEPNTGNLIYENAFGIETWKDYDNQGNLYTVKDGNLNTTIYQWKKGAISSISNPIYTINREINWNGTIASETDGRACAECTTRFEYDNAMRLIKKTPPIGNPIIYTYQFGANAYTRQARGGFSTTTTYDGLGREVIVTDSIGNRTNTHYSSCGLKEYTISNTGDTQHYDHLGRQTKSVHQDGTQLTYTNHSDRHITITDEANYTTHLYFDTFADPSEKYLRTVTDPLTNNATYSYNVLGSLTTANSAGLLYGYQYNAANLLVQETRPDGSVAIYTHDNVGNVTSKDDSLATKTYEYDDINRLISVEAGGKTMRYGYDNADNLINMTSPEGSVVHNYDGAKRLTGTTLNTLGRANSLAYGYDNNDNLTRITFPSTMQLIYTYNALNQVTGITGFGGSVTGLNYFTSGAQLGLLKNYTFSNGQTTALTYDNKRALTITASGASNLGFTYNDPRGNLTAVTDSLDSSKNKSFTYDATSRLKNYNSSWGGGRFDYQTNGNRSQKVLGAAVPYQYSSSDHLTSAGETFAYNGDGDMTRMGDFSLDYNPFHRLFQVLENGAVLAGYGYDANGLRIYKTGSESKIYLNGPDGNVLSELDGSGNTIADYVYLNGILVAKAGEPDRNPVIAPWLLLLLNNNLPEGTTK